MYTLPYFTLTEEKKAKYIWKTYRWIATRERARSSQPAYCESLSAFLTLSQVLLLFPPTLRLAVQAPQVGGQVLYKYPIGFWVDISSVSASLSTLSA